MNIRHFILATAGHVDHGKSSLVRLLTGTDPDRLPEEKARGMTIDLGFAYFAPSPSLSIGVVDVPGHEDFVKNMVAGVGAVDAALLVVAADDGWMPQTEEHLQILQYLGVQRIIVALTKSDLLENGALRQSIAAVRERLIGTGFQAAPIVPTSIRGAGLDDLRSAIVHVFDAMNPSTDIAKPRLQIDRSFQLRGIGRVVTGTLGGGTLTRGQSVTLAPANVNAKIRAIQSHNKDVATAVPGIRVAINLPDLPPDQEWRGQTVTLDSLAGSHDVLDVLIQRSNRSIKTLRRGLSIHVHHGTRAVAAKLYPFGDSSIAQLRLESPLVAFVGDRLVLRDSAQLTTLAGAIVLDPSARRGGMQLPERLRFLQDCAQNLDDLPILIHAIVSFRQLVAVDELLRQSHFSTSGIAAAIAADARIVKRGGFAIAATYWNAVLETLSEKIRAYHREHPEQSGILIAQLRPFVQHNLLEAAIDDLYSRGFIRQQTLIRHQSHHPALPARLEPAGKRLRLALEARPMEPPSRNELTPDALSQQALAFLKINGEVIELSPLAVISASAFEHARERVCEFLRQHGQATVTELKTAMGTSRRIAVPLLEKLDQAGVTRRDGDLRRLRTP